MGIVTLSLISVRGLIINCLKLFEKIVRLKSRIKYFRCPNLTKVTGSQTWHGAFGDEDRGARSTGDVGGVSA